jgi:hypothetical protein
LSQAQPCVVTRAPELNEVIVIVVKIVVSIAACARVFSSGRYAARHQRGAADEQEVPADAEGEQRDQEALELDARQRHRDADAVQDDARRP